MGILSDFEDRVGGAIEGLFAGAFKSPVQPVEIAKALARAADDGRTVGVGTVYAPTAYTVALSAEDNRNLGSFLPTLGGELATYLVDHARERGYLLSARPKVTFTTHRDLKLGRFRVSASHAAAEEPQHAAQRVTPHRRETQPAGELVSPEGQDVRAADEAVPAAAAGAATITIGDSAQDMVLDGEEVLVGRVAECDVRLSDANVSRRHAAFIRVDDGWAIADLGSTNGTRLNGEAVEKAHLHDGDVVEIGLTRFVYHEPGR